MVVAQQYNDNDVQADGIIILLTKQLGYLLFFAGGGGGGGCLGDGPVCCI